MNLRNITNSPFRYLYLLQAEGVGTQFIYISLLLEYATRINCKLIVDFRKWAFFSSSEVVYEEAELARVLCFDTDRIIYRASEIDRIIREQVNEVLGVIFYEPSVSLTKGQPFPFVWVKDFLPGVTDAAGNLLHELASSPVKKNASCYLKGKLKLQGEYREKFAAYQPAAASCLGVHARFGNGEQYFTQERERFDISWERFFSVISDHPEDKLFVCTDTPSFLQECLNRYEGRVVYVDRHRPPENCGPGLNIWSICVGEEEKENYLTERNRIGPYRLLGEALLEMLLLGECRRLVCSKSFFSHYARAGCNVEAIILE